MATMGKYLYCFIKEKEKKGFGTSGIGNLNAPVYTINYNELSAVVSEAPIIDYDPSRKNLLAHQAVLMRVMANYTLIPVAFGTVANNKKEIETILSNSFDSFLANIKNLKDKIELGLRIVWNDKFNEDIERENIKALKSKIIGKSENEVFAEKIQLGQMVEASIKAKREEYEKLIFAPLSKLSAESKLKESLPIKTVLNAYFLVDKSNEENFDQTVEELTNKFKDRLIFSYTGPWPPYNFINMTLHLKE